MSAFARLCPAARRAGSRSLRFHFVFALVYLLYLIGWIRRLYRVLDLG
jgi:hypothetical protein